VIAEAHAGGGDLVDIGSLDVLAAVTAQHPGGQAIHQNQQNIRPVSGAFRRGEGRQREAAEKEVASR
jgi:hypothetical protein